MQSVFNTHELIRNLYVRLMPVRRKNKKYIDEKFKQEKKIFTDTDETHLVLFG